MLKIEKTEVFGWEAAIRGMRNPMNSWDKSDSCLCIDRTDIECDNCSISGDKCVIGGSFIIGENDLTLMKKLVKAGDDHAKFLRMINVTMDITAPLYWWKEFDTYKVGTVANSCSTMHKIHAKGFTVDDFSCEHLNYSSFTVLCTVIEALNRSREDFINGNNKADWWQMIQILPTSYNQKRTVQLNYQVLKNMRFARRNHKLDEWHTLCTHIESLPYFKEVCDG